MVAISTALITASGKAVAGPLVALITKLGPEAYAKLSSKFEGCFQGHVDATRARCSKMKNILYRDNAVDFLSQYENIEFSSEKLSFKDRDVLNLAITGERILISGTAGAGKTMFMRWSTLDLIDRMKNHGRVPMYLEMRYFQKEYVKQPLEKYIYDNTSSDKDSSSFQEFIEGLKSGIFIIMLDAIDEINPSYREDVIRNLMTFLQSYPDCGMVISSRFDDKLESIQDFKVLRTKPMNKNQIISVIIKLDYDNEVKSKLIDRLRNGLYEDLNEFLSNPLLATIMLLSFDHSADIPTKLTSFYQQAFEALYQRHDAAKGAYKRDHYAQLPLDRFQSIFSTFSFQTYLNYKFEFSDAELLEAFSKAAEYEGEEADAGAIIKDSMESICLIQREGLDNVFSHRSFQEYFCALFISKYKESDARSLIHAVAGMEITQTFLRCLLSYRRRHLSMNGFFPISGNLRMISKESD